LPARPAIDRHHEIALRNMDTRKLRPPAQNTPAAKLGAAPLASLGGGP
jgi:hypothetical protein